MFPCSSRVKLNRVALKDVVGLKAAAAAPRRRRVPTSLNTATADPQTKEENLLVSEPVSVEDTASVSSNSEPVQTLLPDQTGPADTLTCNIPDEEPVEKCSFAQKEKRSSNIESCKGKRAKSGDCRAGMWDRGDGEDPGPGSHLMGAEMRTGKRIKLGASIQDGIFSTTPDLKSTDCKNPATTDSRDNEKTGFWTSDESQSCSECAVGGDSTFGSAVEENCVHKKPCGEKESDAAQMSSELFCERNEVDRDEPESLTCQRVRVYSRKNIFSCARTYMSWPFSNSGRTPKTNAGTTACAAEHVDPSDNTDCQINQKLERLPSSQTNETLPNEPRDSSSDSTYQASHLNEKLEEDGESISTERNQKRHRNMSSHCSDNTNTEFVPHLMEPDKSLAGLPSDTATLSRQSWHGKEPGTEAASASSLPANGPQTDSSTSAPSPSALFLSDWETATSLSSMSSPFTQGGLSSPSATASSLPPSLFLLSKVKSVGLSDSSLTKAVEKTLFYCEETRMTCSSSSCPSLHNSEIFNSGESSLLLPQDEQDSNKASFRERCPPKLEPYYKTSPINYDLLERERLSHSVLAGESVDAEFMLPIMLSPVTSPQGHSWTSFLPQSPGCQDEEEEEVKKGTCKISPGCQMPQIVNVNNENGKDFLEPDFEDLDGVSVNFQPWTTLSEPQASPSTSEENDCSGEESQDQTDCEDDVEKGYKKSDQLSSDLFKIKATFTSGDLTESCSSTSSDEEDRVTFSHEEEPCSTQDEGSSPSEICSERDQNEAAGDTQQAILDEFTAYKHDILLVDVIPEDPELFKNLPQKSVLKLGPARVTPAPRNGPVAVGTMLLPRTDGAQFEQRLTPVSIDFHCESPDITEENNNRPWRPKCRNTPSKTQNSTWSATEKQTEKTGQPDANNNHESEGQERSRSIQTVNSLHNHIPPLMSVKNGPWITNPANMADFRRQKCNTYCRQYFSESLSCGFKMCRFQHVPVEGDEKFCIETVSRFIKNPMCLQKAGAVFTGYYNNNPPGVYFSMPVLLNLLWALLKASMVSEVFSVLSVSLAHKIVPGHEFLLALFNFVREKGLVGFVPELIQLTSKMASAGLVLSLDCLDCVKNTPEVQQTVSPNSMSGNHKLSTGAPFPEYLNLAHAIVEIELCSKQEDWRRMGEVFKSNCPSSQHFTHMEKISGRIAIALLSESKDKLSLPFGTFAETVCQNEGEDSLVKSFLGRIGVSLMLRYHKTHQWAKGRRVVEVLSTSKVNYTTLKGLFGNENGASRCYLVTVATELFLLSGSVEGALNTLRENQWFLSSSSWPCEPADLESRTRVLMRLAEKTSHRDALDILCNLPGLKEPNDLIDISRYCPLFNSHLQVCLDRQKLPVASDTVDFMLCKNLAIEHAMLQILLHKLAKQNLWLRAREVFRHSLSMGYYPGVSAPPGFMALIVPCELGEVELALTLEMVITVNATVLHLSETTPCCLSITLKRTQSCESEYLSAGSRLLSAACIPQPKLLIHYKAVNSSQEQVFNLDISSARCWLRHNHLWANEVWAH
ncbi:uncharacterized protein topaz1 isoform 2-T2 [Acanthopagrus schlegelii]